MLQLIPNLQLQFSAWAMLKGPLPVAILTSAVVLTGFILPNLWQLMYTPPIRVIRQQTQSTQVLLWTLLSGTLSLFVFSLILTENLLLTSLVIGGIIALSALLYVWVWLILKALKRLKIAVSAYVKVPYQTAFQITALALGLSLITVLAVLRTDLLERWQQPSHKVRPISLCMDYLHLMSPNSSSNYRHMAGTAHPCTRIFEVDWWPKMNNLFQSNWLRKITPYVVS